MESQLLERWLRLTQDALRGAEEARRALALLSGGPMSPDGLASWARSWLPQDQSKPRPAELGQFQDLVEEWWKAIGVVPRYRYLELLEKCDELRRRLEESEATARNLRDLLARHGAEAEATKTLAQWEENTRKFLDAQAEWTRTWTEGVFGPGETDKKDKATR